MTAAPVQSERARKLRNILHALAPHRFPRLRGEELRLARLDWTARLVGRTLTSSKDLSDAELSRAVHALLRQVPEAAARRFRGAARGLSSKFQVPRLPIGGQASSKSEEKKPGTWNLEPGTVLQFPNRGGPSVEQGWKIRQIAAWMGWDQSQAGMPTPQRLEGFLQSQFGARNPEQLTAAQAWKAIEALKHVAARVSGKSLAEVTEELRWWRPETEGSRPASPLAGGQSAVGSPHSGEGPDDAA